MSENKISSIPSIYMLLVIAVLSGCGGDSDSKSDSNVDTQSTVINHSPSIRALNKNTRLEQPITFSMDAQDTDSDQLKYSIVKQAKNGVAVVNNDSTITYTPAKGSIGIDLFEVQVSDGELIDTAKVTIDNNLAFKGNVAVDSIDGVEVLLIGDGYLINTKPDSSGDFRFYGVPDGDYAVKVRKNGYKASVATVFTLNIAEVNRVNSLNTAVSSTPLSNNDFELEAVDSSNFSFHWEEDQSTAGYDYSAHINEPLTVEYLGDDLTVFDDSAANELQYDLNILLVDSEDKKWTQEHAYRIAEIMKTIPQKQRDPYKPQSLFASKWLLTSDFIKNDIQITTTGNHKTVLISDAAFVNSNPKMAKIEGKRGVFYSQRLHHALVRFVTDNGSNKVAYEKILNERYGVSTFVADYPRLTAPTGHEGAGRFQSFHSDEIIQLIDMFEEMPKGMHKLPELKYLLRRLDGTPHPKHPDAPAVSWTGSGYIEFMESAFKTSNVEHMHRLVLHEKAHFLWEHQFDAQLKNDWIDLGGWYEDGSVDSGWATTKQTEFVSAYAHLKNPNEDMAESISYFIINPDLLKSRAIGKYKFIRDRIMQGNIYISKIQDNLTFQVYNLFPDYVFPGKIKRLDINVDGMPEEDKTVTVEIELHALDAKLEGAESAYLRVISEIGTYRDLRLYPVNADDEVSTVLRGSFTLSKYVKSGFWRTQQIKIIDPVGNKRMEGANDFGWKLYIDTPLEDVVKPEYVKKSASLTKSVSEREGQEVQIIHAKWAVDENNIMANNSPCYASMNDEILYTYRVEQHGTYDHSSKTCSVDFVMPHYMPKSTYSMNYIRMIDLALNKRGTYFTGTDGTSRGQKVYLKDEWPQKIELVTNNQDIEQPELDLNHINIVAEPTNQEKPNGETIVTVSFNVRDNISGYNIARFSLRDPQGNNHPFVAYNDDAWSIFPTDDVTVWHRFERKIVLPAGSAPGKWGLSEMTIQDRAGNFKGYDFTTIMHFDVIDK